jgi:hypothetical protein
MTPTPVTPAIAVIDGALLQLTRVGTPTASHTPLATAVVEFRQGPMRFYVREHPYGLLPGIANLYCLDGALRLQWIAEWPWTNDPCAAIVGEEGDVLVVTSTSGIEVHLDANTGRLLRGARPMAAAS